MRVAPLFRMCDTPFLAAVQFRNKRPDLHKYYGPYKKFFFLGVVDRDNITTLQVRKHTYQSLGSL